MVEGSEEEKIKSFQKGSKGKYEPRHGFRITQT